MVRCIVLRISTALAVALTAGAVLVATGSSATATQGQAVLAGQTNTATSPTVINNTSGPQTCSVPGTPTGLVGCGDTGVAGQGSAYGVFGSGISYGVGGSGDTGVAGLGNLTGVYGVTDTGTAVYATSTTGTGTYAFSTSGEGVVGQSGSNNGVHGLTSGAATSGVWGENEGGGYGVSGSTHGNGTAGVWGSNSQSGIGVKGTSAFGTGVYAAGGGVALQVSGRAEFSTAGTAVIASGQKKVTVTLAGVTATDFVLATVQGSGSFYVKNATAGTGQFTITINKAPTAPATVTVAYFVISAS